MVVYDERYAVTFLSVVIPTRNRAELLGSTLQSITTQSLSTECFEVVVADNGSVDGTRQIVAKYQKLLPNLRYEYVPEIGLHAGRHRGFEASRGEILVFADDDIEAFPTWLATYSDVFSDETVAMAGGNNLPKYLDDPPQWIEALWRRRYSRSLQMIPALSVLRLEGERSDISPHLVWGCNFAIRRNVLIAAGGFHPDGFPEEKQQFRGDGETAVSAYVLSQGLVCIFDPGASVYHKVSASRMTHEYFKKRGFAQGISDSYTALRGDSHAIQKAHIFQRILRKIYHFAVNQLRLPKPTRKALRLFAEGYHAGYAYHRERYQNDPTIRAWVHKTNYW